MNLVGNLEDLGLGEIMQIVSLSRKSGILTLNGIKGEGQIVFRQGEVVRAASPEFRESLADLLLRKGSVDPSTMDRALSMQERGGFKERLGTILVRHFHLPAETLEEVIREQIEKVVCSFFAWVFGTFDFELQEHLELVDSMESDPLQFMLDQGGINSQYLAIEGLRRLDEMRHRGADADDVEPLTPELPPPEKSATTTASFPAEELSPSAESSLEPEPRHVIVLVDDRAATREPLTASLEACGYEVYPFAGGADSPLMMLASLYRDGLRPTLLIDLIMPKMDGTGIMGGVELLELVQTNFTDMPVLAMADCHNEEAEREVRRMGFPLIMKPREDQIDDPGLLNDFMAALLPLLKQVRSGRGETKGRENVNLGDELRKEMGEPASQSAPVVQSTGISLLRGMLEELNDPALGGGIILLVLRFASEFMNRAVIFIVKRDRIVGLGQFGIDDVSGKADSIVRNMKIPREEESLFAWVIENRLSVKIESDDGAWTRYLLDKLGGETPAEIFVGPLVSEGKVVALLYGDNLPGKRPIGDTDSLEIFLSQAGVAMEKAFLQRKLKGKGVEGM